MIHTLSWYEAAGRRSAQAEKENNRVQSQAERQLLLTKLYEEETRDDRRSAWAAYDRGFREIAKNPRK